MKQNCHQLGTWRNSKVGLEAINCFSKLFLFLFYVKEMKPPTILKLTKQETQGRCNHQPSWNWPSLTTRPRPMTFALFLMQRSLQEGLRPHYVEVCSPAEPVQANTCLSLLNIHSPTEIKVPASLCSGMLWLWKWFLMASYLLQIHFTLWDNFHWCRVLFNSPGGEPTWLGIIRTPLSKKTANISIQQHTWK